MTSYPQTSGHGYRMANRPPLPVYLGAAALNAVYVGKHCCGRMHSGCLPPTTTRFRTGTALAWVGLRPCWGHAGATSHFAGSLQPARQIVITLRRFSIATNQPGQQSSSKAGESRSRESRLENRNLCHLCKARHGSVPVPVRDLHALPKGDAS